MQNNRDLTNQIYSIDEHGIFIEDLLVGIDEVINVNHTDVRPTQGLYRAKWNGTEWVEDMSLEEFEEDALLKSLKSTQEEIENAELEIKILTLLQEVLV